MEKEKFSYTETYCVSLESFLGLGQSLGQLVPSRRNSGILDILVPKDSTKVVRDSLTKRYGYGRFPAHTDGAYLRKPPRLILLRYVGDCLNPEPTVIVKLDFKNLTENEIDFLKRAIWVVRGVYGRFYSSIYENGIVRYDPEVMQLASSQENRMNKIIEKSEKVEVNWEPNKVLVLNNWFNLHYRPEIEEKNAPGRILQRINIV